MTGSIDARLLENWETSRRHHEEARLFVARRRFPDPHGETRAVEQVIDAIAQAEKMTRAAAWRPHVGLPSPSSYKPCRSEEMGPPGLEPGTYRL